jgi:hypothetical protein
LREFLEETIVLDHDPADRSHPGAFRNFTGAASSLPGSSMDHWRKHAGLRRERDKLASRLDPSPIQLDLFRLDKDIALRIVSSTLEGEPSDPDVQEERNVLVCFSLRDLGIEVVKVVHYKLGDNDYLLDGEIDQEDCLVRMPMALFSCSYLAEIFSSDDNWYHYDNSSGEPPSIKVRRAPTEQEVHFFPWDVEQRIEIINGRKKATAHEVERFKEWYRQFRLNFLDANDRPSLANPSPLFVPGTAKILNLFFRMAENRRVYT